MNMINLKPFRLKTVAALGLVLLAGAPSVQALEVFACEPEWGALVQELAGDKATVFVATSALQDVHQIEARPSLIARMRRTELLVCAGAELEQGWLPQLQKQAGNSRLNEPARRFFAAEQVSTLDKPDTLDRSGGDVHAAGNPHVHLDPNRLALIAEKLGARLVQVDAVNAAHYQQRTQEFLQKWQQAKEKWQLAAAPLRGKNIIVRHDNLRYLSAWLGLNVIAKLEPKPGVPPSVGHLSAVLAQAKPEQVWAIVQAAYEDPHSGQWLSEKSGVPLQILPFTVGGDAQSTNLFKLMERTLSLLVQARS